MNRSKLPSSAFIDPHGSNRAEIRALVDAVLELAVAHATEANSRSPVPVTTRLPPIDIPHDPVPESVLLADIETVLHGCMNPAHPGYMGHMDPMPATVSVLGDIVASTVNNNMLSVEMSPVFSRLESRLLKRFAELFGLGEGAGGILLGGGSLANLQALALARNAILDVRESGVFGLSGRPVLFASELCHTSVQKAAMMLGLGTDAVVAVSTDSDNRMDTEALEACIRTALADGKLPFCVVATAGTTVTGSIDPLIEIHRIAKRYGLWFHVDAVFGGAMIFSDTHRHRLIGVENADSLTFNPQKWCYVSKTCAMLLMRDMGRLDRHFRVRAPYMNEAEDVTNLGEISVQGTRYPDILKLWLTVRHLGRAGLAQLIDESFELMELFVSEIRKRPALELASNPETVVICFRAAPKHLPEDQFNRLNAELQAHLLQDANLFLSRPWYREAVWLKAVLLNPFTEKETVLALFARIDQFLAAQAGV